ncbi:MAG: hypothetical protein MSA90_04630 [Faecalicatena sp.]|nr:hypothetical protein [Faecalicatena sp.]MCI6464736.1 hypothetical protein [Faecalicatena sp.]MDY5618314.1 hypothetical protein [Lachnospiraceae bacterium]
MAAKRRASKTSADTKGVFSTVMDYEMFRVYWRYICSRVNKHSINRGD